MDVLYTVYIKKPNIVFFSVELFVCGLIYLLGSEPVSTPKSWNDLQFRMGGTTGYVFCLEREKIMLNKKEVI